MIHTLPVGLNIDAHPEQRQTVAGNKVGQFGSPRAPHDSQIFHQGDGMIDPKLKPTLSVKISSKKVSQLHLYFCFCQFVSC